MARPLHEIYFKRTRRVDQFTLDGVLVEKFESIRIASTKTNTNMASICLVCKGTNKTAGGFIWKYNNDISDIKTSGLGDLISTHNQEDYFDL